MDLREIKAISVCSHFDLDAESESSSEQICRSVEYADKMYAALNTDKIFVYPYACCDSAEHLEEQNLRMLEYVHGRPDMYMWAVLDPRSERSMEQCLSFAGDDKVIGAAVLPAFHGYALPDFESAAFAVAEKLGGYLCVAAENNVEHLAELADRHKDVNVIMSAMKNGSYIQQLNASAYGNLYADTSSGAMINDFLLELAAKSGVCDRILYADGGMNFIRSRIEYALIADADKRAVLRGNAEKLFAAKLH